MDLRSDGPHQNSDTNLIGKSQLGLPKLNSEKSNSSNHKREFSIHSQDSDECYKFVFNKIFCQEMR